MNSLPLIPKSSAVPNLDVTSVIREIFQSELETYVPSKKVTENIRKSLEFERNADERETYRSVPFLKNLQNEKGQLMDYAENVIEAYTNHEKALDRIANAELNVLETQVVYLKHEELIQENDLLWNMMRLKRISLVKPYKREYVKNYKLLQGESGLPPEHEAKLDFRLKDFKKWRGKMPSPSIFSSLTKDVNNKKLAPIKVNKPSRKEVMPRPKKAKVEERKNDIVGVLKPDAAGVYFTNYKVGEVYENRVTIRNVHTKPIRFTLKPLPQDSPFKVALLSKDSARVLPGLSFKLLVTFKPKNLNDDFDSIIITTEDDVQLMIPIVAYLEAPGLKSHQDLNEREQKLSEKLYGSCIDCGQCFPGDSKVVKIKFYSFGGTGEFFLMSHENWNNWFVENLTPDNFTEIPPFRLYPSYFKIEKHQVIDMYVEFKPPSAGLFAESVVIACSNGEFRNLDILGDGIAYHHSFFTFEVGCPKSYPFPAVATIFFVCQDSLEKNFSPAINDDLRANYFLDMGNTFKTGRKEKVFSVTNNSNMPFDFRWEMRDAIIPFGGQTKPEKLSPLEVKVEPSSGVFEPGTTRKFFASVYVEKKPIGQYRTVLSLYVTGLPYESIEEASTVIRPSVLRRRFISGSLSGEEENLIISPEHSYQDTFESVQEGMKTSVDFKCQQTHPAIICMKHPYICALPLNKSKTFTDEGKGCTCNAAAAAEQKKDYEPNAYRKPNITDLGSDMLWDYVDILVDEIEVWFEIGPAKVRIEPCILNINNSVRLDGEPVQHQVYVKNLNEFPIVCKWVKVIGEDKLRSGNSDEELNMLYRFSKGQDDIEMMGENESTKNRASRSMDYRINCFNSQKFFIDLEAVEDITINSDCDIHIEPWKQFTIPPQSQTECDIYISSNRPGIINSVVYLSVEDAGEHIPLYIIGQVPDYEIAVNPHIIDFGFRRSGARFTKCFKIKCLSGEHVEWKIEQYDFDYEKGEMVGPIDWRIENSLSRDNGLLYGGDSSLETFKLDTRKQGLRTSILKFDIKSPSSMDAQSVYLLILGNVKTPELAIEAPRFQNAILAPNRTMYVGKILTQYITLRNMTNVATTFIWGNPFGCHARKLKIQMRQKYGIIRSRKKVVVQVRIIPLEEGFVEHFYIPCFFTRNAAPVILSIVGVVRKIQVTFLIGRSDQPCGGLGEVLQISWPIRNFDPLMGLNQIPESRILDFECHCDEIDEEYKKAEEAALEKDEEMEEEDEEPEVKPCMIRYSIPQKMEEVIDDEYIGEGERMDYGEGGYILEESESVSTVAEYPEPECIKILYYAASELQFLNVLNKTVAVKHFVIKNDTPLKASFSLELKNFGKVERSSSDCKLHVIRERVLGRPKDEFEKDLIYGQPLLISLSPSEGILEGFQSVRVTVSVYGNTWGEYRDIIVCNIRGMPPFVMKVFVQLSGHPILFPMFNSFLLDVPVLRFNVIKYKADACTRTIRVKNASAIPITVTWMVFLSSPIPEDLKEEPFTFCLDFYTDKESEDPEKATKSSHNYLSKNTSGSAPHLDMIDLEKESSQFTGRERMTDSEKRTNPTTIPDAMPIPYDATRPEIQLIENFGKNDWNVFRLHPQELDLEPYSESKMTVSFNPNHNLEKCLRQDFQAIVTGCVRLRQEHAHYPNVYLRPCGKDYISKLLVMTGSVERPLIVFEFFNQDLKFTMNANDVLLSKNRQLKLRKKYIVRNKNETSVTVMIDVRPGNFFVVKRVFTKSKVYAKFDSDCYPITIDTGESIEVHVEAVVEYNQVLEMWRNLKYKVKRMNEHETRSKESIPVGEGRVFLCENSDDEIEDEKYESEEIRTESSISNDQSFSRSKSLDTYLMLQRRSKKWMTLTSNDDGRYPFTPRIHAFDECEYPGEQSDVYAAVLPPPEESVTQKPWCYISKEMIVFKQPGLAIQAISPELRIFFPTLKLNPEIIDFGNVYIGEKIRKYASIINLIQFPMEIFVTSPEELEFCATPKVARLPATHYKTDIGLELEVTFSPKEPGYFKAIFKVFGNREMIFGYEVLTVFGFGTWNEKYKYPRVDLSNEMVHSPIK